MKMDWRWVKGRWFEFRIGHGTYLSFLLSFTNFVLISYNLLIERIPFLKELFPNLWLFVVIGITFYVPVTVLVGHWHNKKQLKTDIMLGVDVNPYWKDMQKRLDRIEKLLENLQ